MNSHTNFLAMISTEFHRYLMENEEFAENIPPNALVIFQVEREDEFNSWHKDTSLRNHQKGQPIIYVYVKKWRMYSSIEEIKVANAIAC